MFRHGFLLLPCLLLFSGGTVRAESILYLQGDPEHFLWHTYALAYGSAQAEHTEGNGYFNYGLTNWSPLSAIKQSIDVGFTRDDSLYSNVNDWALQFSPALQSYFELGLYDPVARFPFQSGNEAGLSIVRGTNGCNQEGGWFRLLEYEVSGGVVNKLAIDFMHICDPGTNGVYESIEDPDSHEWTVTRRDARLFGSLRINSEIAIVPAPPAGWLLVTATGLLMARWRRCAPGTAQSDRVT